MEVLTASKATKPEARSKFYVNLTFDYSICTQNLLLEENHPHSQPEVKKFIHPIKKLARHCKKCNGMVSSIFTLQWAPLKSTVPLEI
jgi:hypothetical protein